MQRSNHLGNYLEQIGAELIIAGYFESEPWWKEYGFTPDFYKFYYLTDGDCYLEAAGQIYHAKAGDLCLLPAGVEQSYYLSDSQQMKKYWCHFSAAIGERQMSEVITTPVVVSVSDGEKIERLFQQLIFHYESGEPLGVLQQRALLLALLYEYFSECDEITVRSSVYSKEFSCVMDYIDAHYDENMKVEDLASLIHLQPNYFIKYFKKNFGDSPMKYVNKLRIEKAKELLKQSTIPVAEIARRVGIEDSYYFSRLFKKYAGVSPKSYRDL